ncbi:Vms1/Ankzf1 family peptidyl-tRNA hydrolase [Halorarius halobius]|uniref:Vms1/Ankzf1 family peptidyl-tRNA hydrolase n=1 Tax=Halorarius halobius TaxID=2962671 RepID=UPI0020CCB303|nr:Vms1/Ankzf1 family peptidyl-tRNA hydrolase [Halorarius halobius]
MTETDETDDTTENGEPTDDTTETTADESEKREETLRERIEEVSDVTVDDDRLVTVAVPPDGEAFEAVREEVAEDRANADHHDEAASKPYQEAMGRVHDLLQSQEELPANGLVVYAGVVDGEAVTYTFDDMPRPVDERVYTVANTFDTGPLEPTAGATDETYGLLVVERGGAALGRYDGTVTLLEQLDSDVRGKTRKGGQSEERFERRREEQKEEFFEEVATAAERAFIGSEGSDPGRPAGGTDDTEWDDEESAPDPGVDALLVGGTDVTVEQFADGDHLDHRLDEKILDTYAVEYASEQGLRELVEAASERLEARGDATDALSAFLRAVGDDEEPTAYGRDGVDEALTYEAVETLVVSEALDPAAIGEFEERAAEQGGDSVVVPADTEDGSRFEEAFDGVGAHLRFPVE